MEAKINPFDLISSSNRGHYTFDGMQAWVRTCPTFPFIFKAKLLCLFSHLTLPVFLLPFWHFHIHHFSFTFKISHFELPSKSHSVWSHHLSQPSYHVNIPSTSKHHLVVHSVWCTLWLRKLTQRGTPCDSCRNTWTKWTSCTVCWERAKHWVRHCETATTNYRRYSATWARGRLQQSRNSPRSFRRRWQENWRSK